MDRIPQQSYQLITDFFGWNQCYCTALSIQRCCRTGKEQKRKKEILL